MDKVAITGIGMVTPLGVTAVDTVSAWGEGRRMSTCIEPGLAGTPLAESPVAQLPEFDPARRLGGRRMLKFMSAGAPLGCMAAQEAHQQADAKARFSPENTGLFSATGLPAADLDQIRALIENSIDENGNFSCRLFGEKGLPVTNPLLSFRILANMPACIMSIIEGVKGENSIYTPWESQAGLALREGWLAIADGEVDCALVGGEDCPSFPFSFVYLRQAGYLKENEVPAKSGAYLFLERLNTAREAGKEILAVIEDVTVSKKENVAPDPLTERIGRTIAAAPFIMTGIACYHPDLPTEITGIDGWTVSIKLGTHK